MRYRISLIRLAIMTVLSFGTYPFYWFYLTWKQYRNHTGELVVYPVWHALALLVPIYNLFRAYRRTQALNEMMLYLRAPTSIRPRQIVFVVFLFTMFVVWKFVESWPGILEITFQERTADVTISVLWLAVTIILLAGPQRNLNRYWTSLPNASAKGARIGVGEVVLALAGSVVWYFFILEWAGVLNF